MPWFEVDSIIDLGHIMKSQGFQHFTSMMHSWVRYIEKGCDRPWGRGGGGVENVLQILSNRDDRGILGGFEIFVFGIGKFWQVFFG